MENKKSRDIHEENRKGQNRGFGGISSFQLRLRDLLRVCAAHVPVRWVVQGNLAPLSTRIALVLLLCCTAAGAVTVHKNDDTTVSGDITAIDGGNLTIAGKPKPVVIPLEDIAQVVIKEPVAATPAPPPPTPAADENSNQNSPSLLGILFGGQTYHSSAAPTKAPVAPATPVVTTSTHPTTHPTSQPDQGPAVAVTLTDGDTLHAKLGSWADQKLQLNLSGGQSMEIPSTAVTELWFAAADLREKAGKVTVEPGPEDVAFVAKDETVIAVKGLALGIAGQSLQFRYDDQDRKINLSKLVGLLLRGNAPLPLHGFHQRIGTESGDRISGSLIGLDHGSILLNTPAAAVRIPLASITTIDFVNGRVTSLCDLKPTKVVQTPYFGRLIPYRVDQSLTGGPLILSDGPCNRGIAVHSRCVLEYELSGEADHFKTRLGFQQPDGMNGRVEARVLADGKVLYENPDARGNQPPIDIDLPITGVRTLTLEIDFGKDQDVGDRVVWANPRLIRGK
jgi:hypothetical protein